MPIIADFGYARRLADGELCYRLCGTKCYMAPEILECQPYSFAVDIWSFGILLYALATGADYPFPTIEERLSQRNIHKYAKIVRESRLKFRGNEWRLHSDDFKDLIIKMLEKDPEKRLTINDVM